MDQERVRQVVTVRFYQSLSDSEVEVGAIPQAQLQAIANAPADGLFAALDAVEAERPASATGAPAPAIYPAGADAGETEELLWTGRPYLSIGVRYELTTQRLGLMRGLPGRSYHEIERVRVRDRSAPQHMGERARNAGDAAIVGNEASQPEVTLHSVKNSMALREMMRQAAIGEKKRRGLRFREER